MKMQLPPIGGVRKVLKQNAQQSGGTTIAEIGNNTVTLEQLAALIFNLLTNAGTIDTGGQGQSAVLIPALGSAAAVRSSATYHSGSPRRSPRSRRHRC